MNNIDEDCMLRAELGTRMLQWHSSMNDPVYAVGSFFVDDKKYPDVQIVCNALRNLEMDLYKFRRMDQGIKVTTDKTDDLKKFAGYKRKDIREHIKDLREIVSALRCYLKRDYE